MGSVSCEDIDDSDRGSQCTCDVVPGSIEYYNLVAHGYEDSLGEAARTAWMKHLMTENKDWVGFNQMGLHGDGIKAFDYCAGTGLFSRALAPHVSKVLGMDNSQNMVIEYNKHAEYTQEAHPECELRAVMGDLVYSRVPLAEIPYDFLPFDLLAMCLAVDFFAPNDALDDDATGLLEALKSLTSRIRHNGTLLIIDIEKESTSMGASDEDDDEDYETKIKRSRNGKKVVGYGSVEIRTAFEALGMEDIAVIGDLWYQDPADGGQVYFLLKAKKGHGSPTDWEQTIGRTALEGSSLFANMRAST